MNKIEMDRYFNALAEIRVYCSCSHTMYFPVNGPDVKICTHCGNKVYKNDRVRFIDILTEKLKIKEVRNG